jgi:hypothetical protein
MEKSSKFVFDGIEAAEDILNNNSAGYVGTQTPLPQADGRTRLEKILGTAADVGNVFSEIDKVVNPGSYPAVQTQYQTQQQPSYRPQQAGFGWGKALLLAGVAGSVIYAGKQVYDKQKKKAN